MILILWVLIQFQYSFIKRRVSDGMKKQSQQLDNIGGHSNKKIKHIVNKLCELCSVCEERKVYKCLEEGCVGEGLLCPKCEVFNLQGKHFNHQFTFIIPLFKDSHGHNIKILNENLSSYLSHLQQIYSLLQDYAEKIKSYIDTVTKNEQKLRQFAQNEKLKEFYAQTQDSQKVKNLDEMFAGLRFPQLEQYRQVFGEVIKLEGMEEGNLMSGLNELFKNENNETQAKLSVKNSIILAILGGLNEQNFELKIPYRKFNSRTNFVNYFSLDKIHQQKLHHDHFHYIDGLEFDFSSLSLGGINYDFSTYLSARSISFVEPLKSIEFKKLSQDELAASNLYQLRIEGQSNFIIETLKIFENTETIEKVVLVIKDYPNMNVLSKIPKSTKSLKMEIGRESYFNFNCNQFWLRCFRMENIEHFQITPKTIIQFGSQQNIFGSQTYYFPSSCLEECIKLCSSRAKSIKINGCKINGTLSKPHQHEFNQLLEFEVPVEPGEQLSEQIEEMIEIARNRRKILYSISKEYIKGVFRKKEGGMKKFERLYEEFLLQ